MDPTIPRRKRSTVRGNPATTWGWFYRTADGTVRLSSHLGATWPIKNVSIRTGSFGHANEGLVKLPRPRELSKVGGEILVQGDNVTIQFIDGDSKRPLVEGGIRRVAPHDFLPYNHEADGASPNRLAGRIEPLDEEGKPKGLIEWELSHDDDASLRLMVKSGDEIGPRTFVAISDFDDPTVEFRTSRGTVLRMSTETISVATSKGDGFQLDSASGDLSWYRKTGELIQIRKDIIQAMAKVVELVGSGVSFTDGSGPATEPYLLTSGFLTDLAVELDALWALAGGASPGFTVKLVVPPAANIYMSKVIKGM